MLTIQILYADDKTNNQMLRQVLRIVKYLVNFGYFWSPNVGPCNPISF